MSSTYKCTRPTAWCFASQLQSCQKSGELQATRGFDMDNTVDDCYIKLGQKTRQELGEVQSLVLTHDDYEIGWICALPEEQTAAIAMLDARYSALPKSLNDHNAYTLGRIGKHNVVIACLPKGQNATIAAAKAAQWMLGTFPSLRFGLMVGIGAGMPSKVRLGDIVVSCPVADYPGVVQWDLGKAEDGGRFMRTGALNNPHTALLTALSLLESQHTLEGSKISQYLDDAGNQYPPLKLHCVPPNLLEKGQIELGDLLPAHFGLYVMLATFGTILWIYLLNVLGLSNVRSTHEKHKFSSKTASVTDFKESSKTGRSREPRVHYGLIASSDRVVKDAALRDYIDKSLGNNLLCIGAGAAGLMNDFPCIVIRGICDYADAHKDESWQNYAAITAAGYAKELLSIVSSNEVKQAPGTTLIKKHFTKSHQTPKQSLGSSSSKSEPKSIDSKTKRCKNSINGFLPSSLPRSIQETKGKE